MCAEVQFHSFVTSALDGKQSTSRASRFTPVKYVGTSAGLAFKEEKNRVPLTGFKLWTGLLSFVVFFVEFTAHVRDDLDSVERVCQNLRASPDNISQYSL